MPFVRSLKLLTRRQRVIFLLLVTTRVLTNLLDVFGLVAIGLLGSMLASGLNENSRADFGPLTVEIESNMTYVWVIVVVAVFFISKSVVSAILLRLVSMFLARIEHKFADEIARYIYSGSLGRMRQYSRGDIHFALTQSTMLSVSGLLIGGSALVTETALFLSVFAVFLVIDPLTAVFVSFYFILLVATFQLAINVRLKTIGQRISDSSVGVTNSIQDLTNAFREIMIFAKRPFFLDLFSRHRQHYALDYARLSFFQGLPRFFVESALMIGVLGLLGYQFLRGDLTDGLVTATIFLAGGVRMMGALLPIQNAVASIKASGPQAALAQGLLEGARETTNEVSPSLAFIEPQQTLQVNSSEGLSVSFDNVVFQHLDGDHPVLKGISLEISPGSFAAFIGPSGAGKTTLADLVLGINLPTSGEVLLDGIPTVSIRDWKPGIVSYVPQDPGIVSGTIAGNVALGVNDSEVDEDQVWDALRKAQLVGFVEALPKGINTHLGKQSDALSGGQRQRLGLARALYTRPRLLVLDEATSALDSRTESEISSAVTELRETTTVVVIAHRISTIQDADVVFVVENGLVSATGTFSEVRRDVPLVEEYVRLMKINEAT